MIGIQDQCFGVEIEMTGLTRQRAAEKLGEYLGSTPVHIGGGYDAWEVRDSSDRRWKVMRDGSIAGERKINGQYEKTYDSQYQVEFVTPKLSYEDMPVFQECIRQLRHAGGKVNESCGLHCHIDGANHNRQSLKNLLSIMYSKEDILFKALQVNENRVSQYCQKVREPMLQQVRDRLDATETRDLRALESIWYDGGDGSYNHYHWTRYFACNLHSMFYRGTVEFRMFNSTLHAGIAKAYVNLCLAISAQAINQRCTVMRKTRSDNELFTFRVWLVRMGLNGSEYENTRMHLLSHLEGDKAWRYSRDSYKKPKQTQTNDEPER